MVEFIVYNNTLKFRIASLIFLDTLCVRVISTFFYQMLITFSEYTSRALLAKFLMDLTVSRLPVKLKVCYERGITAPSPKHNVHRAYKFERLYLTLYGNAMVSHLNSSNKFTDIMLHIYHAVLLSKVEHVEECRYNISFYQVN